MKLKRHSITTFVLSASIILFYQPAEADIYRYSDENGVIHFSNVGVGSNRNYKKVKSEPQERNPNSSSSGPVRPQNKTRASQAANFPTTYGEIIESACGRHGVDPALVHAVVKVESDFNPYALSKKGAMGLMQLMPETAINMNVRDTFNPHENIDGGVKYLRYLIDRYEGNLSLALAAYNSGESAVRRWGAIPPFRETREYVRRIMQLYKGSGNAVAPRYTIFVGYGEDGALMLTDDPSKHKMKILKRAIGSL
jgi:soluble lytic murein transglycosylase-like protein